MPKSVKSQQPLLNNAIIKDSLSRLNPRKIRKKSPPEEKRKKKYKRIEKL
jgi:hypothetical protein